MESNLTSDSQLKIEELTFEDASETFKNQTLPQLFPEAQSKSCKNQKPLNTEQSQSSQNQFKLKFNMSKENLRCFISKPKIQKYRSVSTRIAKQSKSQVCLSNLKLHFNNSILDKDIEKTKSQTQRQCMDEVDQTDKVESYDQNDLSKISNQIIHCIEKKGINYNWNDDIEEIKSQEVYKQYKDDQELQQMYLEKLYNTFSDKKKSKYDEGDSFLMTQDQAFNNQIILQTQNSLYEQGISEIQNEEIKNSEAQSSFSQQQLFENSYEKNYSLASTQTYSNLYYPGTVPMYTMPQQMLNQAYQRYDNYCGLKTMPSSMFHSQEFIIKPEGLGKDPRTTIMIKNIPNKYTIHFLSQEIDQEFGNYYDFLYLPCDTKSGANQGYGFINFTDLDAIKRFYERFHGKKWRRFRSEKICNLTYARLQGIASLIEHFQNSKVLNHKEKKYQPVIKKLNKLIKEQQIAQEKVEEKY